MHEQLTLFDLPQTDVQWEPPAALQIKLDGNAMRLLLEIARRCDYEGKARPSKLRLQELMHFSAQQLHVTVVDLERAGVVSITHHIPGRRPGRSRKQNTYYVTAEGRAIVEQFQVEPLRSRPPRSANPEIIAAIHQLNARRGEVQVAGCAIVLRQAGNG